MKRLTILLLTISFSTFFSCEKRDDTQSVSIDSIIGTWTRTDVIPSGGLRTDYRYFDMQTSYSFKADGSYSYKVDFYGFEDEDPNEIMGQSENVGTFETKGDSIFMRALRNTSWEKGFKPKPETIELNGAVFDSKFEILESSLTLYYISYPADAPEPTQMSYKKVD